tara:strand:+ start:670 stop:1923 length:1254 start_codon:yes stop_codon:yes gene_type:complete
MFKQYKFYFLCILFLLTMALPFIFTSSFAITLLSKMGVLIIFAVAYNMLLGQSGLLSFGHAIYFGLAGYATVHIINGINDKLLLSIPITIMPIFGAIVGLILGILIGYLSTKRIGTAFALISLGFCELITAITLIFVIFFNGEDGIEADRVTGIDYFGITYGPHIEVYYLILFWCFFCVFIMYLLTQTPFGKMCNAVRDNAQRAEFIGYNIRKIRWLAFSLSATFAGVAGSLHAINYEHIGFETVSLTQSGNVLFMAYIGGIGNFLGPIIGAISLTYLETMLSGVTESWVLYLGLIFVLVIAYAPQGISGLVVMHGPIFRIKPKLLHRLLLPYLLFFLSLLLLVFSITLAVEYIHSLRIDKPNFVIYWVTLEKNAFLISTIILVTLILGFLFTKKSFEKVKENWDEVMEDVKLSIKK